MKLAVISSSPFVKKNDSYFAYSPYVKELDIWAEHASQIAFMCPVWENDKGLLISEIAFPVARMFPAKEFNIKSVPNFLKAIRYSFLNFYSIFQAMRWADHIHLRCPGNIGLMACLVQILFPGKPKTAKYAGNWDPNARQPRSYKLQQRILSNTFLTRKMQVLVYGQWPGSSGNIKPFFTASYKESDKIPVVPRKLGGQIGFVFVGTFSPGKRPMYAVKLVEALRKNGFGAQLSMYGHGVKKHDVETYIRVNGLEDFIHIMGNQPQEIIKKAYQESHFVILPSKSEGWPKVIAEGMFWGAFPISTKVSCLPFMLDQGNRGLLLDMDLEKDTQHLISILKDHDAYGRKVQESMAWSRKYTLDLFADEIKALLKP